MKDQPITANTLVQTHCLYGPSGSGKTTLAATAPRALFLDSNQGVLSVAEREGFEHVRRVDVFTMEHLDDAYGNFTGQTKTDWRKKFGTCVFDHFDDIQSLILDELAERAVAKDDRRDPDAIEQREYGIMGNRLRRYIRKFKQVKIHKILICGEKEDRETGRMRPALVGALGHQLPYLVDHTMYLRIGKKGVRYLHLDSTEDFYAKTRAHWLTPEQRKLKVDFSDTKFLTQLFARIAAGPKGTSTTRGK